MCFAEGCLARKGELIYVVKGLEHPRGYLTALPRYEVVNEKGGGVRILKLGVKDPDRLLALSDSGGYSIRVIYSECAGRATTALRLREVDEFYDPLRPPICEEAPLAKPCKILEHFRSIAEEAQVGLTGSSYFAPHEAADVDLLVYAPPDKADVVIEKIRRETSELEWSDAFRVMLERSYAYTTTLLLKKIKESVALRKALGTLVFLRLMTSSPFSYRECDHSVVKGGTVSLIGKVVEESGPLFPYAYKVEVLDSDHLRTGTLITVKSDRGMFSELASVGSKVMVRGDYELLTRRNSLLGEQIYLWSRKHYLLPMS